MKAPGVILAGGLSRRMGGGDKSLLELDGQSILARVIERLSPQVSGLALNANDDPARFDAYGLPVIADSVSGRAGPLAGVLAAMLWAAERGSDVVVTAAADTPFFPVDLVAQLDAARRKAEAPVVLAATIEGDRTVRHPTFGIWETRLADDLDAALHDGIRRVVEWTDRHGAVTALFDGDDPFFNINTPDDLAHAKARVTA